MRANVAWGLELGGSTVRLIRVRRTGDGFRADCALAVPRQDRWQRGTPRGANGASADAGTLLETCVAGLARQLDAADDAALSAARKSMLKGHEPLAVCLPDEMVLFSHLALPDAPAQTMARMVRSQLEALLPAQDGVFATASAAGPHPWRAGLRHVSLCAVRKDALAACLAAAGSIDRPAMAVPACVAVSAALAVPGLKSENLAVLDVGARCTAMTLLCRGRPMHGGVIDQGGDHWTERLAVAAAVAPQAAESLKLQSPLPSQAQEPLEDALTGWAQQLAEVYEQAVADLPADRRPTRCALLGGAADTPGLAELFGEEAGHGLRLPAGTARPPAGLTLEEGVDFSSFAAAIGAAVCAMDDDWPACRLPGVAEVTGADQAARATGWWRLLSPAKLARPGWPWLAAGAWLLAAVILLYALDVRRAARLEQSLAQVQAAVAAQGDTERQLALARYLDRAGAAPLDILAELSDMAPPQAQFTTWRYGRGQDMVLAGIMPSEQEFYEFTKKLSSSPLLRSVTPTSLKNEQGKVKFELSLTPRSTAVMPASAPASQPATGAASQSATGAASRSATGPASRPASAPSASEPAAPPSSGPVPTDGPRSAGMSVETQP